MRFEEYEKARHALLKEHTRQLRALAKEYALAHNTVKIGDIVSNSWTTIKVEKIEYNGGLRGKPMCIYTGPRLTKQLAPYKNGDRESIWQNNVVEK